MKTSQVVAFLKFGGSRLAKLERKHLVFDGIFASRPIGALFDVLDTLHNIVNTVGSEELLLKGSNEFLEGGIRSAVGIQVPCFGVSCEEERGDSGLVFRWDAREIHIFIDAVDPFVHGGD
jgi:hypothetical protein